MIATYESGDRLGGYITFRVVKLSANEISRLKEGAKFVIEPYREKRSLDANAYMWILCTKIAEVVRSSKDEVYEEMIQKYGYMSEITITVKSEVDMGRIQGHWKYLKESQDGKFKAYQMIRGTSEYNRSEMAHFIDMVVSEAKELDIETLPESEIQRMMERIGEKDGNMEKR